MNFIKKNISIIIITLVLLTNASQVLAADNLSTAFGGEKLKTMAGQTGYNVNKTTDTIIGTIIQAFLSILGIIFLILMLYGGYLWMTDRGESKSVEKAQSVIRAAVIGLFIVLISYSISYFVIKKFGDETLNGGSTTDNSINTGNSNIDPNGFSGGAPDPLCDPSVMSCPNLP